MRDHYKFLSIISALGVGCLNASQTVHAKFMTRNKNYGVLNLTSDTGLLFTIICIGITLFNLLYGSESITLKNFGLIFVSSSLGMICWLVGQNCSVKGLAGPTIAIIYSGCFFTTGL